MTHCPPGDPKMTPRQAIGLGAALVVAIILYGAVAWWALGYPASGADLPKPDCWPWWQCNGTKDTNHPNCKCWETR